ncbi:MAG TPA: hypothetical protein VGB08_05570 [Allosphingosinicella sp.]|jgi:hypothetical protein
MKKFSVLVAALSLPLAGCYSMAGPPQVINANGILPGQPRDTGALETRFRAMSGEALKAGATPETISTFMRSGFTLVYARCNNYFTHAGRRQMRSRLARDSVAPLVGLLTGIINLHDFGTNSTQEQRLLDILTLGQTFGTAGLDVYDRNFLFGSDNIDAVRTMTLNALSAHASAALGRVAPSITTIMPAGTVPGTTTITTVTAIPTPAVPGAIAPGTTTTAVTTANPTAAATAEQAFVHLIDNQMMCSPPHILALAREAMRRSNMQARDASGTAIPRGANELESIDVTPN